MADLLMPALKISLVIFMAGNLMDMGLRLEIADALRGLRNLRFVVLTLLWAFLLIPGLAYGIAHAMPLDAPYALGLILMGLAPCAPFVPMLVAKGHGDLGSTAAFMLLTAVGTVIVMPVAVPLLTSGLTVSAWSVARPLLVMVLIPMMIGMAIRRASVARAGTLQPVVKKVTGVATLVVVVLCVVIYGNGLLGLGGTFAVAAQCLFFATVATVTYLLAFGLPHEERIVLSIGLTTRNIGAAIAPLLAVPEPDQQAAIMVVLGLPLMVGFAMLVVWMTGRGPAA
ncbi:bile acid:sodium symporter [Roseomonas sp. PWR1]|uniref:Bile acid:sodium symporter n=1 Tax=Roseomonas nitratireducens TaxID=2820810 RepID=A0ABS4AS70_9PROT|nr:bile acid:sodium symporter [Neoroseomonas nitratireducens]MBP0464198.1 bile acid:sodium symporter [Neoroseomonas nitratireducens]